MYTVFGAEQTMQDRAREWRDIASAKQLEKEVRCGRIETEQQSPLGRAFLVKSALRGSRKTYRRRSLKVGPLFIAW
jgi:hypothetical protein